MIRSAAKIGARVIFVSTSGTVGCFRTPDEWADEDSPFCEKIVAKWPYYDSKIAAEKLAVNVAKQLGVPLTIVRIPVLLGPEDTIGRSTSYVRKVIEGRFPFYVHGGIAYADVRDVAEAVATLAKTPQFVRPVLHLPGHDCSLGEFFSDCARIAGTKAPNVKVPRWLALGLARSFNLARVVSPRLGFLPDPVVVEMGSHFWAIRSKYAHEIGFRSRPREQTLGDTIAWLRSRG
jgi:nucleoside-diphosphate-sugar epimerase